MHLEIAKLLRAFLDLAFHKLRADSFVDLCIAFPDAGKETIPVPSPGKRHWDPIFTGFLCDKLHILLGHTLIGCADAITGRTAALYQ